MGFRLSNLGHPFSYVVDFLFEIVENIFGGRSGLIFGGTLLLLLHDF